MAARTAAADFAERSARIYERQLREQLLRHGTPEIDPEDAGRRAAMFTASGQAWANDVGPFYDTDGARAALGGVTKQAVSQRVTAGRLLGLRLASDGSGRDRMVYPAWQFRDSVLRALPGVLQAAGYSAERPVMGWTIAAWLTSPNPELGGMTPVKLLAAGHADRVVSAAAEVAVSLGVDERAAVRAAARAELAAG
ncbi:MAG: hypothetical protein ACRD2Z_08935 [Thermoanaerobaculia bacterium]